MAELLGYQGVQARLQALGRTNAAVTRMLGMAAVREQKLLVRRKTGTTGRTIRISQISDTSVTTSAAAAALWLEKGTRPHVIRPRVAKVLAWSTTAAGRRLSGAIRSGTKAASLGLGGSGLAGLGGIQLIGTTGRGKNRRAGGVHTGAIQFRKMVKHPGTRPYPFMLPGARKARREAGLIDTLVKTWNGAR